jgi:hypothetical protein
MTAAAVPARSGPALSSQARSGPAQAARAPWPWPARLLRLELRRSAMLWVVPLVVALFWFDTYRSAMTFTATPLWSVRTFFLQKGNAPSSTSRRSWRAWPPGWDHGTAAAAPPAW